jgi:hypothetical protein
MAAAGRACAEGKGEGMRNGDSRRVVTAQRQDGNGDSLSHGHLVTAVRVSESSETWAQYSPAGPARRAP